MALEILSIPRQKVFDDALAAVEKAVLDGHIMDVHSEAQTLLDRHPDSGMAAAEVEAEIMRLAGKHGVAISLE